MSLTPGGWLESHECSTRYQSDDESVKEVSALNQWGKIYYYYGKSIGTSFSVIDDGIQMRAMEAAGFVDIQEFDYKVCIRTAYIPLTPNHPLSYLHNDIVDV